MKVLVFRFSAMGDVALLAPVLKSITEQNSQVEITLVTRPKFAVFFEGMSNVKVWPADLDNAYKGFSGLYKLYKALSKENFDIGVDVHQNLRSSVLKSFFKISSLKFYTIDKGRKEKKLLTKKENKARKQLPHATERYLKTFQKAGISAKLNLGPYIKTNPSAEQTADDFLAKHQLAKSDSVKWLGFAPFAQHQNKIWPWKHVQGFMKYLQELSDIKVFLFGGGPEEVKKLTQLSAEFPSISVLVAGNLKLPAELALMKKLDAMLCMDSSNMHFAALTGTPTYSIWGATHTDAGFAPVGQPKENIIEISTEKLPCRPCSIYGNQPCHRGDLACMNWITPEMVIEKLKL
jgi:ADP-heptose:LPS heptosyltransferase